MRSHIVWREEQSNFYKDVKMGAKKEREGWSFSRFWHSGPQQESARRAISSMVERALHNCVVVLGL